MTTPGIDWAEVVARVPRELFIPNRVWHHDRGRLGNDLVAVDRTTEPERWAAMVAADDAIITQVDDGHPAADGTGAEVTSSCSDRRVVAGMLGALAPAPGERVLEIGTGTGWNAALLAALGAEVTTVEIDPVIAKDARARLAGGDYGGQIEVVTDDGAGGWPPGAPFDAVIATVGTAAVPWPWVEQTRPGGRLVVPLTNAWYAPGWAVLTRAGDGASGRLGGPASFMPMRAHATSRRPGERDDTAKIELSTVDIHPYYLTGDRAAAVAIGQRVEGVSFAWHSPDDSAAGRMWLYGAGSWASVTATDDGPPYRVRQAGPRRLVDEVLAAYVWWTERGSPGVDAWQVAVTAEGQRVELGTRYARIRHLGETAMCSEGCSVRLV